MVFSSSRHGLEKYLFEHLHLCSKFLSLSLSLSAAAEVSNFIRSMFYRLNVLSINRFERKKNIGLAIAAFALLHHPLEANDLQGHNLDDVSLTIAGKFLYLFPPQFKFQIGSFGFWGP